MRRHRRKDNFKSFIGLDLSLACSGFSAFSKHGELLDSGVVKTKPQNYTLHRYVQMATGILDSVKSCQTPLVLIEDYAFGAKGKVFHIGENGAIVKYMLWQKMGVPLSSIRLVSIAHLKMFATGKGNAKKDLIMREVYKRWGFEGRDDNETDAFVLGKMAWHLGTGKESGLNAKQIEALNKTREHWQK